MACGAVALVPLPSPANNDCLGIIVLLAPTALVPVPRPGNDNNNNNNNNNNK